MDLHIYYYRLFDLDGRKITIGGVQNYLINLIEIAKTIGLDICVIQRANQFFEISWNNIKVIGLPYKGSRISEQVRTFVNYSKKNLAGDNAINLFGADHFSIPMSTKNAVLIQHGISWDLPISQPRVYGILKQLISLYRAKNYFDNCNNRVCVDYNFLNWYRTLPTKRDSGNIWVIPNFSKSISIEQMNIKNDLQNKKIRILFARRFFDYRGTRLFSGIVDLLLQERQNVYFTFAGEGPDMGYLEKKFRDNQRVTVTSYGFEESQEIHYQHDIAVVPSLGSEGTSFSVLEAMGAGCAVIATNVGGITNLIINNYNGILINPKENELHDSLLDLIDNPKKRKEIALNAWNITRKSFSYDAWKCQWENVFLYLLTNLQ